MVGASPWYPPRQHKYVLVLLRVLRINSVLYRMGGLRSPYDPSLLTSYDQVVRFESSTMRRLLICLIKQASDIKEN